MKKFITALLLFTPLIAFGYSQSDAARDANRRYNQNRDVLQYELRQSNINRDNLNRDLRQREIQQDYLKKQQQDLIQKSHNKKSIGF